MILWKTDSEQIGVLADGGTITGIFAPCFFQAQFLDNPEDLQEFFDFQEDNNESTL